MWDCIALGEGRGRVGVGMEDDDGEKSGDANARVEVWGFDWMNGNGRVGCVENGFEHT
jgi:hypothetical protein